MVTFAVESALTADIMFWSVVSPENENAFPFMEKDMLPSLSNWSAFAKERSARVAVLLDDISLFPDAEMPDEETLACTASWDTETATELADAVLPAVTDTALLVVSELVTENFTYMEFLSMEDEPRTLA